MFVKLICISNFGSTPTKGVSGSECALARGDEAVN